MKKIRKMDEMELMIALKTARICYVIQSAMLIIWNIINIFTMYPNEALTRPEFFIMDAGIIIQILVETIFNPTNIKNKKEKNEK